ncbi:MAG: TolC family protein [Tannerellaceae bacterium]|jgi:outer membrane protein|nr:TolC family protein [Tannerellaceae bacterium]
MTRNLSLLTVLFLLSFTVAPAQEKPSGWTLHDCLEYALEHNIQLKKSHISLQSGQEDTHQARAQIFPSLSASISQNVSYIPSSSSDSYTGNYSVSANWTLFDGNRRSNAIKQQELQDRISVLSVEQNEREIQIALVQNYMQVLYAYEAVRISENTVEVSKAQLDRAGELLKAGSISRVSFAQMESQYSSDKYQLVVAGKNLDNYKLQLKQLLELDITDEITLAIPGLGDDDVLAPLQQKEVIYALSLAAMPEVRSGELSVDIAELETKKAAGGYLPSLSMSAGLGTGNGSGASASFGDQLRDRFNETVGLTLSVPIFSNRTHRTAVNKARFSLANSRLELLGTHKALLRLVEGVYLDATSAQSQYLASVERLKYVTESYRLTEEQFFLGMKNTLELLTEKNNMLNAQQEELQSKYMAIISIQLLNIYQKKPVNPNY